MRFFFLGTGGGGTSGRESDSVGVSGRASGVGEVGLAGPELSAQ